MSCCPSHPAVGRLAHKKMSRVTICPVVVRWLEDFHDRPTPTNPLKPNCKQASAGEYGTVGGLGLQRETAFSILPLEFPACSRGRYGSFLQLAVSWPVCVCEAGDKGEHMYTQAHTGAYKINQVSQSLEYIVDGSTTKKLTASVAMSKHAFKVVDSSTKRCQCQPTLSQNTQSESRLHLWQESQEHWADRSEKLRVHD